MGWVIASRRAPDIETKRDPSGNVLIRLQALSLLTLMIMIRIITYWLVTLSSVS
jgi:hypothetical protein